MIQLEQYFKQIQGYKLSAAEKNDLYQRIIRTTQGSPRRTSILQRASFYTKLAGYSVVLWLLGLSFYIPYLSQHKDTGNLAVSTTKPTGIARADLIAKVVTIQWEYSIEAAGARIASTDIADGDTVILSADSKLVVAMGEHMEGTIQWPARFTVQKTDAGYSLSILEGDFIEIANIWDAKDAPEVSIISVQHKYTTTAKAGSTYHVVLTEEDNKPLVVNKWGQDVTVTTDKTLTDIPTTQTLAEHTSIDVSSMIILAANTSPITIGKTLAAQSDNVLASTDTSYNDWFFRGLMNTSDFPDRPVDATNASATSSKQSTGIVAQTVDRKELRSALIPQFVWVDVKYITYYYLEGKDTEYAYAYNNLRERIVSIFTALGVSPADQFLASTKDGTHSLAALNTLIVHLQYNLPSEVSLNQEKTLNTISSILSTLEKQPYWALAGQWLDVEDMFARIK